jgi:hypothetical protein
MMPPAKPPDEPRPLPPFQPSKHAYHPPELRDLGRLAEVTKAGGGNPSNTDNVSGYS